MSYPQVADKAAQDGSAFWLEAAMGLDWTHFPKTGYDAASDTWFADGVLNSCYNAVDRHVAAGRGEKTALIYESPVTGKTQQFSFAQLQDSVALTAGMIAAKGVSKGDRVIIYMPMVPEAVFAMLACARIGAVHSVVFGGFAAPELAKRIDDCQPKLVMSASCGIEGSKIIAYKPLLDHALELAEHKPECCIILQREQLAADITQGRDVDWADTMASAAPADCVSVKSTDPLYILYTSGTTGTPKGVVRDNGSHATALHWSMKHVYGAGIGDVYWAASDIGWVVGHSYIVYGPLLAGCTTLLFEGKPIGTPDAGIFWNLVDKHQVNILFTAPTAIRAIRRGDPDGTFITKASLTSLRALFLAGERADPDTLIWIGNQLGKPVIDHWWQTELGWPAIATCFGLGETHIKPGSAGRAVPGFHFKVLDDEGQNVPAGTVGNLLIEKPLAPGAFRTLWNNPKKYDACFTDFPGYYLTGDAGMIDEDGYIYVMGRTDDIINVAGHRLSTGQMEQVVASHASVVESAVVSAPDELKGDMPVAFIVWQSHVTPTPELAQELISLIRTEIGPIAAPRTILTVAALPKTRSGKVLRNLLRALMSGQKPAIPQTIEDASVVDDIALVIEAASQMS